MAAMLVVMVVLFVVMGHHGMDRSHDAKSSAANTAQAQQPDPAKHKGDKP